MTLAPGQKLGSYQVVAKLGAGGMGEVYLARDTALGRNVALKVLPEAFVEDRERLVRFEREAQILASLNHPSIAHIYGIEGDGLGSPPGNVKGDGLGLPPGEARPPRRALVMELVEGEDLSEVIARRHRTPEVESVSSRPRDTNARLARGGGAPRGLEIGDVVRIARQIADALEAAHDQGIVHRDLKPANVKVRPDGVVKVLDFGLAKSTAAESASATGAALMYATTMTSAPRTEQGVILGTAAYMSPEQARGKLVDKRTDIWAFGVLLYEMLTGTRAFDGNGFPDVLAAVLRNEIDWTRLPTDTPPRLRQLLTRCLEADPKQRLRDIGEARVALATIEERDHVDTRTTVAVATPSTPRPRWREPLAWSLAGVMMIAAAATVVWQRSARGARAGGTEAAELLRLSVLPPPGFAMNPDSTNVAISPDGRMVAFIVGLGVSSENQMWVRAIGSSTARRLEGADGASQPFWSPNSERIGFFSGRKLKSVAVSGGPAETICEAPFGRGAAWNAANVIVFAPDVGPLYRVSASGGPATAATTLDEAHRETAHRYPVFLPDGNHFLFAALPDANGQYPIFAGALDDVKARSAIGAMESAPSYAPPAGADASAPGWLLFTRQGVLAAQPFDARAIRTTGEAVLLGDQPAVAPGPAAYGAGRRVSASSGGSLAYYEQPEANTNLVWIDLAGKTTGTVNAPAGRFSTVAVAPDGTKAVLAQRTSATSSNLWLVDLTRASAIPIATAGREASPVWSPDSTKIAFASQHDGVTGIYEKVVGDGSAERSVLSAVEGSPIPRGWSKDSGIIFSRIDPGTKWNIYRVAESGAEAPVALVHGPAIEVGGWPSPDNHWLAYLSDESGRLDLFVQSFPEPGRQTQIAPVGLQQAWWTPDGRHLLYLTRDQGLWRVEVDLSGSTPRVAAPIQLASLPSTLVAMDLAPGGQRFLALLSEHTTVGAVTVVRSWYAALSDKH